MLKLKTFTFNPFQENTYIIWDIDTLESAIIDPGCSNSKEENELFSFIQDKKLLPKYLINTHCHIDHVLGNHSVKEKYSIPFFAPELDLPLLENVAEQAKMFGIKIKLSPPPDKFITEDLVLSLGKSDLIFIFTPGHTPGEYCILLKDENICISGDVLFFQGIGRTDLWGGDYETLINSIKSKLFTLHENTDIYPGHGEKTNIGYEKINNPFFK